MMKKIFALAALLAFAAAPLALAHEPPGPQTDCSSTANPHDYAGSLSAPSTAGGGPASRYTVFDGNTCDIDGNGAPDDFDGDYEFGHGGGFFPGGPWAADPTCDYGLTSHHGPNFHIHQNPEPPYARFWVGSDPSPPTLVPSTDTEDDDGFDCVTDGFITPDLDPDDCVSGPFVHTGTTWCAGGGDGGWWVWIDCTTSPCLPLGHIYAS